MELHQRRYEVIFGVYFVVFELILFMRIILLFMFTCRNLLVKSPLGGFRTIGKLRELSSKTVFRTYGVSANLRSEIEDPFHRYSV
jgi:hypothetical protein